MAVAHKGSISMGLVLIPIGMYKATVDNDIHFNQLEKESKRYTLASDEKSEAFFMLIFLLLLQKRVNNDHLIIREHSKRAVLSGEEKDYVILAMPEVYMISSAYINGDFSM